MKDVNFLLVQLLDEPSFVAWLSGNGSTADNERWEKWLIQGHNRKTIVARAKKLLSMPFIEVNLESEEVLDELKKHKDQFPRLRLKKI